MARVVREPLTDELSFELEYLQVYAHNSDGLTSGAFHWSRYQGDRIGGGAGSSLVTPAYNCSQDSNQSLYAAFKVIAQNLALQERRTLTSGSGLHEQDLADLLALGNDLERYLVPFGGARTDWASDAGVLGGSADVGGFKNLMTVLRSWRTMLPSVAARTLVAIFLRHGASAWVLATYQCGGTNPRISPVMPNV